MQFHHVDASLPAFDLGHPCMCQPEATAQRSLGQTGSQPRRPKRINETVVLRRMNRLAH